MKFFKKSQNINIPEQLEEFLVFLKENKHFKENKNTLLHWSVLLDKPNWLKELINNSTEFEKKNFLGFTPLELSMVLNRQSCISLLFSQKKHILPVEKNGQIRHYTEEEFGKLMEINYVKHLYVKDLNVLEKGVKKCKKGEKKGWITIEQ